eukprot:scaffold44113_cov60-Phaeocystis_antarctica.AAC.3
MSVLPVGARCDGRAQPADVSRVRAAVCPVVVVAGRPPKGPWVESVHATGQPTRQPAVVAGTRPVRGLPVGPRPVKGAEEHRTERSPAEVCMRQHRARRLLVGRRVHDRERLRAVRVELLVLWQPPHIGGGDALPLAERGEQHDAEGGGGGPDVVVVECPHDHAVARRQRRLRGRRWWRWRRRRRGWWRWRQRRRWRQHRERGLHERCHRRAGPPVLPVGARCDGRAQPNDVSRVRAAVCPVTVPGPRPPKGYWVESVHATGQPTREPAVPAIAGVQRPVRCLPVVPGPVKGAEERGV